MNAVSAELPIAELAVIPAWYIWWQHRRLVKRVLIQTPIETVLSIRVLAAKFIKSMTTKASTRKYDHMWNKT